MRVRSRGPQRGAHELYVRYVPVSTYVPQNRLLVKLIVNGVANFIHAPPSQTSELRSTQVTRMTSADGVRRDNPITVKQDLYAGMSNTTLMFCPLGGRLPSALTCCALVGALVTRVAMSCCFCPSLNCQVAIAACLRKARPCVSEELSQVPAPGTAV